MSDNDHDRVQRWVSLPRDPDTVWGEIGGFGEIASWHPWVEATEMVEIEGDPYRRLILVDGDTFLERLIEEGPRHCTYETVEGPLPFDDHRATLSCVAEDGGCHVFWSAYFEPTDPAADQMVIGFYEAGLEALRERYDATD